MIIKIISFSFDSSDAWIWLVYRKRLFKINFERSHQNVFDHFIASFITNRLSLSFSHWESFDYYSLFLFCCIAHRVASCVASHHFCFPLCGTLKCKCQYELLVVLSIFCRLIYHRLNWNPKNCFFSIFGNFDHVSSVRRWSKNRFFFTNLFIYYTKIDVCSSPKFQIKNWLIDHSSIRSIFNDISERNNDYSDTLDFRRWWVEEVGFVTFFVLEVPDYKSAMFLYIRGL